MIGPSSIENLIGVKVSTFLHAAPLLLYLVSRIVQYGVKPKHKLAEQHHIDKIYKVAITSTTFSYLWNSATAGRGP